MDMYNDNDYEVLGTSRFIEQAITLVLLMRGYKRDKAEAIALRLSINYIDLEEKLNKYTREEIL
jgi:hypothetical protein